MDAHTCIGRRIIHATPIVYTGKGERSKRESGRGMLLSEEESVLHL